MSGMDTPETLLQAIQYFSDEQLCIDAVDMMRPDGPRSPDRHASKNREAWGSLNYGSRHEKLNVANRPTTMQLGNRSIRAVLHYVPCG
jgi:hypothetical protein